MNADANSKLDESRSGDGSVEAGDAGRHGGEATKNSSPPAVDNPPEADGPPAAVPAQAPVAGPMAPIASAVARTNWWSDLAPGHRTLAVIAIFVAFGYLIGALAPVLTPFMFGAILSYVGAPVVAWLETRRVPRTVGSVLVILAIAAFGGGMMLVVAPLISAEVSRIAERMPELLTKIQDEWLPWVNQTFGTAFSFDLSQLKTLAKDNAGAISGLSTKLAGSLQFGGQLVIGLIVNLTLVPVVMFYFLRDWPQMIEGIDRMLPRSVRPTVRDLASEIDAVLSEFLRGQGMVMLALATYYCIALKLAGLEFALPVGLVTGLLVFIPYVGFGLGLMLGMLAALTQFTTPGPIIAVAAVFLVGQVLEGFVLVPYLVGDRIGLHPLAVIFALMAFGQLFGFVGVLLALPASAALLVALRVMQRRLLDAEAREARAVGETKANP
ncbi:MAG: AI-2E family transporter [Burkholderiales bacterium]|nr:AI-2E family transporter [Burkholderiales bacterium]